MKRFTSLAMVHAALVLPFYYAVRPWHLQWGATDVEVQRPLPGDEIVANARTHDATTRAITIDAPPDRVWPWLAQIGQDRGGFYSFELLEDLVGCEMENADRVHSEFQKWEVGDKLWMYPPEKAHGIGHALLLHLEPGRALGFATRQIGTPATAPYDGSWSFVVEPLDARRSRLLIRGRAAGPRGYVAAGFDHFLYEPIHFVMERKMLHGIKVRAEGGSASEGEDVLQVGLWTMTFFFGLLSIARVFQRERWRRPLATFAACAVVFGVLTLLQPPLELGTVLVIVLAALLWPSKLSRGRPATLVTRRSAA